MKHLLRLGLLLTGLASCSKKASEPVAPFPGHWQADAIRTLDDDASGQVTTDRSDPLRQGLDITATTRTFTGYRPDGTPRTPSTTGYTRSGEDLVFAGSCSVLVICHVRALTSAGFTYESDSYSTFNPSSSRTASSSIAFHR